VQEGVGDLETISTFQRGASGWNRLGSRPEGSRSLLPQSWLLDFLVYEDTTDPKNLNYGISIKV
jgi:hypothetical protein